MAKKFVPCSQPCVNTFYKPEKMDYVILIEGKLQDQKTNRYIDFCKQVIILFVQIAK